MRSLFIESRYLKDIIITDKVINETPKKLALFTTVQFINQIDSFKEQLKGKEIMLFRPDHTIYCGQVLGCDIQNIDGDFDAFLYIGDGLFHPKALAIGNDKPVYVYNPFSDELFQIDRQEIDAMRKREKGATLKFHSSRNIGVIISTKPGQFFLRKAKKLKEIYPDKRFYLFVANTLDFEELENYPFIDVYVNTMCPRIGLDDTNKIRKPIVNADKLL